MTCSWINDPVHQDFLRNEIVRQTDFFRSSLRADGGFDVLDHAGKPVAQGPQELHTTTRMIHSYCLAKAAGIADCDDIIDAGLNFLWGRHRDAQHGGYLWSVSDSGAGDTTKLAYGHVFVLLAASSAKLTDHPLADRILQDVTEVLNDHYWDEEHGLLQDEFLQDWSPFSTYRGMNANMHGVEAMLGAFEATGETFWLDRSGRILDFLVTKMAGQNNWRVPEHYKDDWSVDATYSGNPMFRPAGTTPGHSFELARLVVQHWDLAGRVDDAAIDRARHLIDRAHADAWSEHGGYCYTLNYDGSVRIPDRYWWPTTEAIGAFATLLKLDPRPEDETNYRALWQFSVEHFIDLERGGWFPEIDSVGKPTTTQFQGKPDIYHSLQASMLPRVISTSRLAQSIEALESA